MHPVLPNRRLLCYRQGSKDLNRDHMCAMNSLALRRCSQEGFWKFEF